MSGTYTVCPNCGRRVDRHATGVIYAVERVNMPGFGQERDMINGRGGFFHPGCSPGAIGWVPRDVPKPRD
jgi:hypothetical protein